MAWSTIATNGLTPRHAANAHPSSCATRTGVTGADRLVVVKDVVVVAVVTLLQVDDDNVVIVISDGGGAGILW